MFARGLVPSLKDPSMAVVKVETACIGKNGHTTHRRKPCLQPLLFFITPFPGPMTEKKKTLCLQKIQPKKKKLRYACQKK
jgi:hypothetical protein